MEHKIITARFAAILDAIYAISGISDEDAWEWYANIASAYFEGVDRGITLASN